MKKLPIFVAGLIAVLVSGCVPYHNKMEQSPALTGRVLDVQTKQPVSGAVVALVEHPETCATTTKDGTFLLPCDYHNSWVQPVIYPTAPLPEGTTYGTHLSVTHPQYQTKSIYNAWDFIHPPTSNDKPLVLKDISLQPGIPGQLPAPGHIQAKGGGPGQLVFCGSRILCD